CAQHGKHSDSPARRADVRRRILSGQRHGRRDRRMHVRSGPLMNPTLAHLPVYGLLMFAGILLSLFLWSRATKQDERLMFTFAAALISAFAGAKLVYLAAEGWLHWQDPDRLMHLATGKSVLGGLLGGYAGARIAQRLLPQANHDDWFAVIAPIAIVLGRIGCVWHGCCPGRVCEPSWFTVNGRW